MTDLSLVWEWLKAILIFVAALVLLERSADVFVDSTTVVAKRLGIPAILIALLTAGAEWEEFAVVVASLSQGQRSLALGNIIGSNIANILGSFSLGLLVSTTSSASRLQGQRPAFDRSAKLYSALLLVLSGGVVLLSQWKNGQLMGRIAGGVLMAVFGVYVGGVGVAIYRGVMVQPEGSDSDSDADSDSSSLDDSDEEQRRPRTYAAVAARGNTPSTSPSPRPRVATSATPLLPPETPRKLPKPTLYHLLLLLVSTAVLSLSGLLLSTSCASFSDLLGFPPSSVGLTILSISTTLPEKLVALYAGSRGEMGVLVAGTVGSNVFLLTLVLGTLMVWRPSGGAVGGGVVGGIELEDAVMIVLAAAALLGTVWGVRRVGGKAMRCVGGAMLVVYIGYLVRVVQRGGE